MFRKTRNFKTLKEIKRVHNVNVPVYYLPYIQGVTFKKSRYFIRFRKDLRWNFQNPELPKTVASYFMRAYSMKKCCHSKLSVLQKVEINYMKTVKRMFKTSVHTSHSLSCLFLRGGFLNIEKLTRR